MNIYNNSQYFEGHYLFEESLLEMMMPTFMPVQSSSDEDEGKTQKEQLTFTGEQKSNLVDFLNNHLTNLGGSRSKRRRSQDSIMNLSFDSRNHIRSYLLMRPFNRDMMPVSRTWTRKEPHTLADVSFNLVKDCSRKLKNSNHR